MDNNGDERGQKPWEEATDEWGGEPQTLNPTLKQTLTLNLGLN